MSENKLKCEELRGEKFDFFLAERAGFEPAVRLSPYTRFPGVRLKPLIHLSEARILAERRVRPEAPAARDFGARRISAGVAVHVLAAPIGYALRL